MAGWHRFWRRGMFQVVNTTARISRVPAMTFQVMDSERIRADRVMATMGLMKKAIEAVEGLDNSMAFI